MSGRPESGRCANTKCNSVCQKRLLSNIPKHLSHLLLQCVTYAKQGFVYAAELLLKVALLYDNRMCRGARTGSFRWKPSCFSAYRHYTSGKIFNIAPEPVVGSFRNEIEVLELLIN